MVSVPPIDQHWWYDTPLSTYDPGSAGRTQIENSQRKLTVQDALASSSLLTLNICLFKKMFHINNSDPRPMLHKGNNKHAQNQKQIKQIKVIKFTIGQKTDLVLFSCQV